MFGYIALEKPELKIREYELLGHIIVVYVNL